MLSKPSDYHALGYYVGKIAGIRNPVFMGELKNIQTEHLKGLGASLAVSGGVGIYHIVGVTPEAYTLEAAFGAEKPREIISFGERELKQAYDSLSRPV